MNILLTVVETRILGCLIEKEVTTPDNYPLSINSLINACNQKSSRDPVMELDEDAVRQARSASDPETRLRLAARVARQIRGAQSATFDLMRGAGVVAPELARLEQNRERLRYEGEEGTITFLREAGRLRPGLDQKTARDIFWMLTGGDVYRMLVRERKWLPQKYQDWLADTLVHSLLAPVDSSAGNEK